MRRTDADERCVIWPELMGSAVDRQPRVALDHEDQLLVGVDVGGKTPARVELAGPEPGMDRTYGPLDVRLAPKPGTNRLVALRNRERAGVESRYVMHR